MIPQTLSSWRSQQAQAAARKTARKAKAKVLYSGKPKSMRSLVSRGTLKEQIVRFLGLLDAKENGRSCRLDIFCPAWKRVGPHLGDSSCHIVPQKRGDAARFLREGIYWGCRAANYGEMMNRDLFRDKHIARFGKDLVEG